MKVFKDITGREWIISVTVGTLKRVRDLVGVDLLRVLDGETHANGGGGGGGGETPLITRLMADPILLCNVLYAVCKPQADAAGVTDESFGESLAGDAIDQATQALLDEIVSFCPNPKDRANFGRVISATRTAMDKARDVVEKRLASGMVEKAIDHAMVTLEQSIDDALAPLERTPAGDSSGAVPASSESTPAP